MGESVLPHADADAAPAVSARSTGRWLAVAPVVVFVLHALNYLYFFIDDEAIPLVFARHLLRGDGMAYNSFEGRVEGYSDFLHVLVCTVWLGVSNALHLGPLTPFFLGKAVSFASGIAAVWLIGHALRRQPGAQHAGTFAGTMFLALAPPLAMWSCSSLELAPAALLITIVTVGLFADIVSPRLLAIAASALVLLRIDGFVYVGALLAPALLAASAERRREIVRQIVLPVAMVLVVYHGWRRWYFGAWLSEPVAAKILYKLAPVHDIVIRRPAVPYGHAFLHTYGGPAAAGGLLVLIVATLRRERTAWALLAAATLLASYATRVGDWMSGFRLFLPMLPAVALLVGRAVSRIVSPRMAALCAAAIVAWCAGVAVHASTAYDRLEYRVSWWRYPSFETERYFSWYLGLYDDLKSRIPPGTRIAYDQAGMLPYLLQADNVDDLGICSRFVARTPTTDVIFTEVGRYSPLTNSVALRTANSYVLYRAPEFVIAPLDLLRRANNDTVPPAILRSHYVRMLVDPRGNAAVYQRNPARFASFEPTPSSFLENLAHPTHVIRGFDGHGVRPGDLAATFPFLAEGVLDRSFSGTVSYDIVFSTDDLPVYEVEVQNVWARTDTTLTLALRDRGGTLVAREQRLIPAGRSVQLTKAYPAAVRASALSLTLEAPRETRVLLFDVRVQGQTPALAAYVRELPFPPPHR